MVLGNRLNWKRTMACVFTCFEIAWRAKYSYRSGVNSLCSCDFVFPGETPDPYTQSATGKPLSLGIAEFWLIRKVRVAPGGTFLGDEF